MSDASSEQKKEEAAEDATAPIGAGVIDDSTKATVQKIPTLSVRAGPRDGDEWVKRQKQELQALIKVSLWLSRSLSHSCFARSTCK